MTIKRIKIIIIVILLYPMISCVTSSIKLEGSLFYKRANHFYFYEDSTFLYKFHGYTKYKYSSGKWKMENGKIIINSELLDKTVPISILESEKLSEISQINVVIDKVNEKDYKCVPFSTTGAILFDPPKGFYTLNLESLPDSIYFEVYHLPDSIYSTRWPNDVLKTEIVSVNKSKGYKLTININDSLFNYRVFDNTILKIRGKKIVFFDKEEGIENKLQLVPKSKYE